MESNDKRVASVGWFAGKAKAMGLLTAGVLAGGLLAGAGIASAATNGASTTSSSSSPSVAPGADTATGRPGGAAAMRSDETLVTGTDLATLKAAALNAVPGGTIVRVETDAGDAEYEAHMTKADGSRVTVKFDKNLAVTSVEDGMGKGDPGHAGQPAAPAGASTASSSGV